MSPQSVGDGRELRDERVADLLLDLEEGEGGVLQIGCVRVEDAEGGLGDLLKSKEHL